MLATVVFNQAFSWRDLNFRMAQLLLILGVLLQTFGAIYANHLLIAAVAFMLLSGHWREKAAMLRSQRTTWWTLAFLLVMFAGIFHSGGTAKLAWEAFSKYYKIFYFIVYLPLLTEQKVRDLLVNTFVISALILILLNMSGYYADDPLINAIDASFLVGFACFIILRKFLAGGKWRWLNGILFVCISSYLLLYNIERTGYVIYFGGLVTVFWQYFRWRGLLVGFGIIMSLVMSLYWLNPTFSQRIDRGFREARSYISDEARVSRSIGMRLGLITNLSSTEQENLLTRMSGSSLYNTYMQELLHPYADLKYSSIGMRLGFIQYSWREIQKHPWLGNGTGSFDEVYQQGGGPTINESRLGHPHNEYVLVTFQWGVVGLLIFLLWQLFMWLDTFHLPKKEQCLLQGLIVCFALLGFCNVSLYVNPPGNVFVMFSTVFLAAKLNTRGRQWISR